MAPFVGFNASDFTPLDTESVTESADRLLVCLDALSDLDVSGAPSERVEVSQDGLDHRAERHRTAILSDLSRA